MEKSKSFKELIVWQKAHQFVLAVYELAKHFPKEEQFGLIAQMRRAAVSVPSNIAEGAARNSKKEFLQYLYVGLGSLSEVETQLMIAQRLGYIEGDDIMEYVEHLRRKLLNFIKHIRGKA